MRTWSLSPVDAPCGNCGDLIRRGDLRLVLELRLQQPKSGTPMTADTMTARPGQKVRCRRCAGEPVPMTLPPLSVPIAAAPVPKASVIDRRPLFAFTERERRRLRRGRDGKALAISREPGEDD
jgi:hypothetical protein